MMKTVESRIQAEQALELRRKRLINYADSFGELARSYDGDFPLEAKDRRELFFERRLWENRQILKSYLREMAKIMVEVAGEKLCCRPMEERKKRLIIRAMREEGIRADNPCYIAGEDGREAVVLTLSMGKGGSMAAAEVADMISVLLNQRLHLSVSSPRLVEKEQQSYVLEQEACFVALTGFARVTKEDESVSGDNYTVLETERGQLSVMLSDGTGSGEKASKDSGGALDLMEKLLEAGYGAEAAVEVVSMAFFSAGEDGNHPTLDLCRINLYGGECELWKAGGAASLLKRAGRAEVLTESNLPLGTLRQTKLQPICRKLQDGDYLFMMTDGVVDAFGSQGYESAVCRAVADMREQNPGELAERLLRTALIASGGKVRDDMTVAVIGVWENSAE